MKPLPDLEPGTHVLASYRCPLINPPSQRGLFENKIHNIRLAIAAIMASPIEPGGIFSFWSRVGAPTSGNGFRDGAMFVDGRVTTAEGGGLCQLSGLIYNLALLAGFEIVERHNHSIDAYGEERYIPLGCDATVAYGLKDLCFRNTLSTPCYLQLSVNESEAVGEIHSVDKPCLSFVIETQRLKTMQPRMISLHDPMLESGQKVICNGLEGKVVAAWRTVCSLDGRKEKHLLSVDYYHASPQRVFRRRHGVGRFSSWILLFSDKFLRKADMVWSKWYFRLYYDD